jgi:hypothetical protein
MIKDVYALISQLNTFDAISRVTTVNLTHLFHEASIAQQPIAH